MAEIGYQKDVSMGGQKVQYVPFSEIKRIRQSIADPILSSEILADIFRLNTLSMIMEAGSGHPGTCLSSLDIVTWLLTQEMKNPNEWETDGADTYFSSKGHDVPALYAVLIGIGKIPYKKIHTLRRLNGLPGHPDVGTPGIMTNTGSLGMGISKARGMAMANRLTGKTGRFYVMTGDGELEEGQIWESLQPTANQKFAEITVVVDHNKMQSDSWVKDTSDLGDLEAKFRAFGWEVARCNGHDFQALKKVFAHFKTVTDKPQILIADTVKAKGVSFMESTAFTGTTGYKYHAGAPAPDEYTRAVAEIGDRINKKLTDAGKDPVRLESQELPPKTVPQNPEKLVAAYGDELLKLGEKHTEIVALDADLLPDVGAIPFKEKFSERFIECGIAEQDMVSLAGGMARKGLLPIAHSFECFLTTRANEQIYNNATEHTKIIYVGTLAGLVPGGPGHSHQSVRGISALGAIPGLTLIEPANEKESRAAIRWAVEKNSKSTYLRFCNIPCELPYTLPEGYEMQEGRGTVVREGSDAAFIGYGPILLKEAWKAADLLREKGLSVAVIDLPWLNRVDAEWLAATLKSFRLIVTLDNHYIWQGQGEMIASTIVRSGSAHPKIISLGVEEVPACGTNDEVLKYHKLDAGALVKRIEKEVLF